MGLHNKKKRTCSKPRKCKRKLLQIVRSYKASATSIAKNNNDSVNNNDNNQSQEENIEEFPQIEVIFESKNSLNEDQENSVHGRRIVDIVPFIDALKSLKHSGFGCSFFDMTLKSEKRSGFETLLTFVCNMCNKSETISTEGKNSKDVNLSAVSGAIAIGIGHTQLSELCSSLNIPSPSSRTYLRYQEEVQEYIDDTHWDEMIKAGQAESKLASEAGDIDPDGVPFITVVVDGAWSKRSYKTNYNALSGVGAILGLRTKRVLYVGVKNKMCCLCDKYKSKDETAPNHKCFKNWTNTSTSMEASIIVEGFQSSLEMHRLRYKYVIGDGDSSVYRKVKESKPYGPNYYIQKIECRNHILRNFCQRVKDLSKRPKIDATIRSFLKSNILRFRTAIVGAIKHRKTEDLENAQKINNLKQDILHGPRHILGNHQNCKNTDNSNKYFCKGPKPNECDFYPKFQESVIHEEFQNALFRVANNAASLLIDVDNNSVENYNAIVNKLVGGKRINFSKRGSYETRCKAAAISVNNSGSFLDILQNSFLGGIVGEHTSTFARKIRTRVNRTSKRKRIVYSEDADYGNIDETAVDKTLYELSIAKNEFLKQLGNVNREAIFKSTMGQISNPVWHKERANRLTASNFGTICKMRANTDTKNLVKLLTNKVSSGIKSKSLDYGTINENVAKEAFIAATDFNVQECGLFIDKDYSFIGATPDGLIHEENAIVEIKCPYAARDCVSVMEAVEKKLIKYCDKIKTSEPEGYTIKLKNNHNYMFQIQGQLHVAQKHVCYFVVYTPSNIHIEKILYDDSFWQTRIVKQLINFYLYAVLPEILDSRQSRNMPIRSILCKDLDS